MMSESERFKIPTLDKNPVKHLQHLREKYASVERRLRAGEPQLSENAENPSLNLPTSDKDPDKKISQICGSKKQRLSTFQSQAAENAEACHNLPTLDKDALKCEIPKEPQPSIKLHKLRILEEIGHGVFGKVYRVEDTKTGDTSALKIITKKMYYKSELEVLKLLKQLEGDRYHCIPLLHSYHTESETMFQFPLYSCTIHAFLEYESPKGLSIPEVFKIMKQVCIGLAFLHRNGIFHADLKSDNIMFLPSRKIYDYDNEGRMHYARMADPKIMLIDFGHANIMSPDNPNLRMAKVCCMSYRPPECHVQLSLSYPVDVWCAGLICFYLYSGHELFHHGYQLELLAQIEIVLGKFPERLTETEEGKKWFLHGHLKTPAAYSATFRAEKLSDIHDFYFYKKSSTGNSGKLFDFMQALLKIDPMERRTMEQVIEKENW